MSPAVPAPVPSPQSHSQSQSQSQSQSHSHSHSHLAVRIADQSCLVDLTRAGELLPVPERVLPVPLAKPWLLGVFSLRGQLMTLIDLARYRGWGSVTPGKGSRVLAFAPALRFNAAILIDEVHGLHTPDSQAPRALIDLEALIREPAFLMVSRLTPVESTQALSQAEMQEPGAAS